MDAKGRVVMPRKFRDCLEAGCFITKGREHCLAVYPPDAWEQEYERVNSLPSTEPNARMYKRSLFAGANDVTPDKQGRIPVPENLRAWAQIVKDVTVVGSGEAIEIWATDVWAAEEAKADEFFSGGQQVMGRSGEVL